MVSLFTGLLIGMGNGVNAIIARCEGARDYDRLGRSVHSALIVTTLYGLLVMVLGLAIAEPLLVLLKTKDELLDGAVLYMRVYLLGTPALAIYNFGNGVLSAEGDSKRPLYYLATAGGEYLPEPDLRDRVPPERVGAWLWPALSPSTFLRR